MPEYLAPGVYIQEVSFATAAIQGVSTTTTGFIGPTRMGPLTGPLQALTSLSDYEAIYGDGQQLAFDDGPPMTNFTWQAARTFFEQGGQILYVARVFNDPAANAAANTAQATVPPVGGSGGGGASVTVAARWPGAAMSGTKVQVSLNLGSNLLALDVTGQQNVVGLTDRDVVWVCAQPVTSEGQVGQLYLVQEDPTGTETSFVPAGVPGASPPEGSPPEPALSLADLYLNASFDPSQSSQIRIVTATVTVTPTTTGALPQVWSGLPLDPGHASYGSPDSIFVVFQMTDATNVADTVSVPIVISPPPGQPTGLDVFAALGAPPLDPTALTPPSTTAILATGGDGNRPVAGDYQPATADPEDKSGLNGLADIDAIAIVAAPGSTYDYESAGWRDEAATIMNMLIGHCESLHYRVAVLDCGNGQTMANVQAQRGIVDSEYAALYYPWVNVLDPISNSPLLLPPSGFVAGIYARSDIERGVWKAPANEVVTGALNFETNINRAQQEVLNPLGINCFRFFEDRGYRLWGARTISSNPDWRYLNVRRYFAYLEHSIDNGTQWVVFEPNGTQLWASVRRTITDFLLSEFQSGALMGDTPAQAFFVKCDQTTMTTNDIKNGRLVCQIGVSPLYPAEFVIFQIGQWTASANSSS